LQTVVIEIFRFRDQGSILLPPRKHSRGVVICQSWLLNFQGSPLITY